MDCAVSTGIRSLCLHLVILTIQLVLRFSHLPIKMEVLMTPSRHPACTCHMLAFGTRPSVVLEFPKA